MPHRVTAFEIVWRSPWVRAITYVVLGVLLIWLLISLRGGYVFALQVGIIGYVIAYILNPLVELLARIRIGRAPATVIVYLLLLNLIVLGSLLISQVVAQTASFINLIPEALDNIGAVFGNISGWFTLQLERLPDFLSSRFGVETSNDELSLRLQEQLAVLLERAAEGFNRLLESLIAEGPSFLLSGATSIISTTLQIFLILLASAYFLYDFPKFNANFKKFVPVRWRPLYSDITQKADRAIGGYLRGQLLITICLGIFIYIGLSIINVPLALAISFLAAIFNLVPYLGPIVSAVPAILLGFTVSPLTALLAIVVFIIANQIEGNLLSPIILSKSVNLHPLTVLLAIMAGLGLLGFLGALLAVPTVALIKVILEDYLLERPPYQDSKDTETGLDADREEPTSSANEALSTKPASREL